MWEEVTPENLKRYIGRECYLLIIKTDEEYLNAFSSSEELPPEPGRPFLIFHFGGGEEISEVKHDGFELLDEHRITFSNATGRIKMLHYPDPTTQDENTAIGIESADFRFGLEFILRLCCPYTEPPAARELEATT